MTASVPEILKFLSNNQHYPMDQSSLQQRAKKRRLDHLSWEEKIQRKKLKNRVAAQTSRDRKKAKMEQMEQALQQLFSQNEVLVAEYENLKLTNEKLSEENAELHRRLQAPCANCSQSRTVEILPSAARKGHSLSSGFESAANSGPVESPIDLPSLPDLLDELNTEVDINSLEQLTQSLLQDIARDLETAAEKTSSEATVCAGQTASAELVGSTPKELESGGCEVLNNGTQLLEKDISEYLLLHHNYAAKPPTQKKSKTKLSIRRKLKAIRPKIANVVSSTNKLAIDLNTPVIIAENDVSDNDILCGTHSGNLNGMTIIVDDDGIPISEAITEIISTDDNELYGKNQITIGDNLGDNTLTVPSVFLGNVSPRSTTSSDNGYESFGSPHSSSELDIWDQSVSELFPTLF
ncbi:hypothetical protein NQ315_000112 [Exocentrus adspersus]|uniref:X-box-binding protein 1 n=1 Tax=Exocentrus adspersus TaxID=1586481 RepID=A0AAV8VTS0_9CUCU|nr:hypothetical protein NQ315_000112 [Exocentrus adspersus]